MLRNKWGTVSFCVSHDCTIILLSSGYNHVPPLVSVPLGKFGISTYGVYLLHPIILTYLGIVFYKMGIANNYLLFLLVCVSTVAIALFSYENYEKKMMAAGKL